VADLQGQEFALLVPSESHLSAVTLSPQKPSVLRRLIGNGQTACHDRSSEVFKGVSHQRHLGIIPCFIETVIAFAGLPESRLWPPAARGRVQPKRRQADRNAADPLRTSGAPIASPQSGQSADSSDKYDDR